MTQSSKPLLSNARVLKFEEIFTPQDLKNQIVLSERAADNVLEGRQQIQAAIHGSDQRLMIIVGPCSIHDEKAALEYAERLAKLQKRLTDRLLIAMRVYFEKPRTTVGWKGLIHDPRLDGSNDMNLGFTLARRILHKINEMGVFCATEFLDPITPQYIADLVSWVAIGARTTESQTHREMASGLSMPVGFKNATDGGLQVAIDAMASAKFPHTFLGIDQNGRNCIVRASGNPDVHIVLRGGNDGPNYAPAFIEKAKLQLKSAASQDRLIMVDCSHGNSSKDYTRQPEVFQHLLEHALTGEKAILGMMLESHLVAGRQSLGQNLLYGQSITDGCIGWESTADLLVAAHRRLS